MGWGLRSSWLWELDWEPVSNLLETEIQSPYWNTKNSPWCWNWCRNMFQDKIHEDPSPDIRQDLGWSTILNKGLSFTTWNKIDSHGGWSIMVWGLRSSFLCGMGLRARSQPNLLGTENQSPQKAIKNLKHWGLRSSFLCGTENQFPTFWGLRSSLPRMLSRTWSIL